MQDVNDMPHSNEPKEASVTITLEKKKIDQASKEVDVLVTAWANNHCQRLNQEHGYTSPKQPGEERNPQWQKATSLVRSIAEYLQTSANTAIFKKIKLLLSVAQTNLRSRYPLENSDGLFNQTDDKQLTDYICTLDAMLECHAQMDMLKLLRAQDPPHVPTCDEVLQDIEQRFSKNQNFLQYMKMYQTLVLSQNFLVDITKRFPSVFAAPMVKFIANEQGFVASQTQNFSSDVIFIVFTPQALKVNFYATQDYNSAGRDRNNKSRDQSQGDWYLNLSHPASIGPWIKHLGLDQKVCWNTIDLEVNITSSEQLEALRRTFISDEITAQPNQPWSVFSRLNRNKPKRLDCNTLIPASLVTEVDPNPIVLLGALCGRPVKELLAVKVIDENLLKMKAYPGNSTQTLDFSALYFHSLFQPHASNANTIMKINEIVGQFSPSPDAHFRTLAALLQLQVHTPNENSTIPDRILYLEKLLIATYPNYFSEHRSTGQLTIADNAEYQQLLRKAFHVHETFGFADVTRLDAGALDQLYRVDPHPLWKILKTTIAIGSPILVDNQDAPVLTSDQDQESSDTMSSTPTQMSSSQGVFQSHDKIAAYVEMIELLKQGGFGDDKTKAMNAVIESAYAIKGAYVLDDDSLFETFMANYSGDRTIPLSIETRCLRNHHHQAVAEAEQHNRTRVTEFTRATQVVMHLMTGSSRLARLKLQSSVDRLTEENESLQHDLTLEQTRTSNMSADLTNQTRSLNASIESIQSNLQRIQSENKRIRTELDQVRARDQQNESQNKNTRLELLQTKSQLQRSMLQNEHFLGQFKLNTDNQEAAYLRMQTTLKIMRIISTVLFIAGLLMVLAVTLGASYLPIVAALSAGKTALGTTIGCSSAAAGGTGVLLSYLFKPVIPQQPVTPQGSAVTNTL